MQPTSPTEFAAGSTEEEEALLANSPPPPVVSAKEDTPLESDLACHIVISEQFEGQRALVELLQSAGIGVVVRSMPPEAPADLIIDAFNCVVVRTCFSVILKSITHRFVMKCCALPTEPVAKRALLQRLDALEHQFESRFVILVCRQEQIERPYDLCMSLFFFFIHSTRLQ